MDIWRTDKLYRSSIKYGDSKFVNINSDNEELFIEGIFNPKYFKKIESITSFDLSKFQGKTSAQIYADMNISKYTNEIQPIMNIMVNVANMSIEDSQTVI